MMVLFTAIAPNLGKLARLITVPGGAIYRWEFEFDGTAVQVDASGRLTLDDSAFIREAALAAFGVAFHRTLQAVSSLA